MLARQQSLSCEAFWSESACKKSTRERRTDVDYREAHSACGQTSYERRKELKHRGSCQSLWRLKTSSLSWIKHCELRLYLLWSSDHRAKRRGSMEPLMSMASPMSLTARSEAKSMTGPLRALLLSSSLNSLCITRSRWNILSRDSN